MFGRVMAIPPGQCIMLALSNKVDKQKIVEA
jgi:hypothetical protein